MEEQVRIVLDTYDKVLVRYKFVERRNEYADTKKKSQSGIDGTRV